MKKDNICYSRLTAVLLIALLLIGSVAFVATDVNAQSKKDKDKKKTEKHERTSATKKHVQVHTIVTDHDKDADSKLHQQKKVIVISGDDTLKNYSINKAMGETDEAMQEVFEMLDDMDLDEIIDGAMAGVDWKSFADSVNIDIDMDGAEVSKEVREAMAEARKEMAAARVEMAEARKEYQAAMAEARKEMTAANRERANTYRKDRGLNDEEIYIERSGEKVADDTKIVVTSSRDKLLKAMEKDGLIDRKKGFKIEKKGDELYIDNIKQSREVFKKYEPMIDAKNLTIKGNYRSIAISATD